ncbi:MAG TPA: hypothetical protein VEX11_19345 [Acetobacteraceae bacterium]|nr:hypothetical protein [Acetobacteraceae bacterium]
MAEGGVNRAGGGRRVAAPAVIRSLLADQFVRVELLPPPSAGAEGAVVLLPAPVPGVTGLPWRSAGAAAVGERGDGAALFGVVGMVTAGRLAGAVAVPAAVGAPAVLLGAVAAGRLAGAAGVGAAGAWATAGIAAAPSSSPAANRPRIVVVVVILVFSFGLDPRAKLAGGDVDASAMLG